MDKASCLHSHYFLLCLSEIGTAGKKSHPGLWPLPLHLQSANCRGNEQALLQCGYQEAVSGACHQGSAVAVCVPPEGKYKGKSLPIRAIWPSSQHHH